MDCFLLDLGVEVGYAAGEDSLGFVVWGEGVWVET